MKKQIRFFKEKMQYACLAYLLVCFLTVKLNDSPEVDEVRSEIYQECTRNTEMVWRVSDKIRFGILLFWLSTDNLISRYALIFWLIAEFIARPIIFFYLRSLYVDDFCESPWQVAMGFFIFIANFLLAVFSLFYEILHEKDQN